jgi:sigma 54 modulation/S30EA-like ribosomal protein
VGSVTVWLSSWTAQVEVAASDGITRTAADYARYRVGELLPRAAEPAQRVRVRLTRLPGRIGRRYLAQANLEFAGRPLRLQVAATNPRAAVDELCDQLHDELQALGRHPLRGGAALRRRPEYATRTGPRRIVRRKQVRPQVRTVDGAALDMAALGYDFTMFVEAGSGQLSALSMTTAGVRLAQARPRPDRIVHGAVPVELPTAPAPSLTEADAVAALDRSNEPFLFFTDATAGAGRVLYRRYDGDYGLLVAV